MSKLSNWLMCLDMPGVKWSCMISKNHSNRWHQKIANLSFWKMVSRNTSVLWWNQMLLNGLSWNQQCNDRSDGYCVLRSTALFICSYAEDSRVLIGLWEVLTPPMYHVPRFCAPHRRPLWVATTMNQPGRVHRRSIWDRSDCYMLV